MKSRLVCLAVIAAAGLVGLGAPASADTAWTVSSTSALPGTSISVSGAGCVGNNVSVVLSAGSTEQLPGDVFQSVTPAGDGTWSTSFALPGNLTPGAYTLWGQCVVQFNYQATPFTVIDPNAPTTTIPDSTTVTTAGPTTTATSPAVTIPGSGTSPATAAPPVSASPAFTG